MTRTMHPQLSKRPAAATPALPGGPAFLLPLPAALTPTQRAPRAAPGGDAQRAEEEARRREAEARRAEAERVAAGFGGMPFKTSSPPTGAAPGPLLTDPEGITFGKRSVS